MTDHVPTQADEEVLDCLIQKRSFSVVAGAGSGKTTSLVVGLKALLKNDGKRMLRDGQKAVCITYTTYFPWVFAAISRHFPAGRATDYASP